MPPSSGSADAFSGSRKRAAAACHACHARKVRCSISQTGSPCTNCALDNLSCQARARQPQRSLTDVLYRPRNGARTRRGQNLARAPSDAESIPLDRASHNEPVYRPFTDHFGHHSQAREPDTATPQAQTGLSPVYGDTQGVGLVADLCEPERPDKSGHFVAAALSSTNVDSDTHEYLEKRGCFALPAFDIQQSLVQAYFHYVHPFLPVIHVSSFLKAFESPGQNGVSLHLLWSVFLAAANFADATTVQSSGYESRKDMKRAMFLRAKALYDANYERSKIVLIQAVLLMGFWYSDTEDRLGPWHWNGIAISLCQTCCFFRETWLSVGMGRPMRINPVHADTPKPDAKASESLYSELTDSQRRRYIPEDPQSLFLLWDDLLSVTSILSRILSVQHLAKRTLSTHSEVNDLERELRNHHKHLDCLRARATDPVLTLHMYHFELFFESTLLTLFRPFVFQSLGNQRAVAHDKESQDWLLSIERKATAAAMNSTNTLGDMIMADMVCLSQSLICIALVPTLQMHLLHSVSPRKLVHRLGCHRLDMCMMVIQEIKVTYFGAEILYRLFTRAREVISVRRRIQETPPPAGTDESGAVMPESQGIHDTETVRSASPMIWAFNAASNYGHGTGTSDEYEDSDVNAILSQCIFPDFGTFQTIGLTDITQPWN
ncbi:probable cutinase transcription factor 1 beta [Fusarium fujikuroi]|nr:probable cutinase transcription factor 1 beta [Fusarium fujikuroi]